MSPGADIADESHYGGIVKFGELKSIGHNIADSLASGVGLPIGLYQTDIFGEASSTPEGFIVVDFLTGTTEGGKSSKSLTEAISLYRDALRELCKRHNTEPSAFKTLKARYGVDAVYGGHFTVTVEDQRARTSVEQYRGLGGHRIRKRR